jgi:ABC-type transporter Mla maintaining outer membrane lipid asymmetry ATPase subunit MlaF
MTPPVLRISNVRKQYHGLRPLRLNDLSIAAGERVAISGLDEGAAEVLVNLVTGASVPDKGEVAVAGRSTHAIVDGDEWLASLDRFGIVSPRAVLLDAASLLQNLAMPYTLDIDPVPREVAERASALGREAGIPADRLHQPIAGLTPEIRVRAHLARAVALEPALLILEHPTVHLPLSDRKVFAADLKRVASARSLATLIISEDTDFTNGVATRSYALNGATGELRRPGVFGRLRRG